MKAFELTENTRIKEVVFLKKWRKDFHLLMI